MSLRRVSGQLGESAAGSDAGTVGSRGLSFSSKGGSSSMKKRITLVGAALVAVVGVATFCVAATASAMTDRAAATTLRIWTDQDRKASVTQVANAWAAKTGASVDIVVKAFPPTQDLSKAQSATAPDVVLAPHDTTGALAADGLVQQIILSKAVKKQLPAWVLRSFSYGGRLYGVPTQIENIGLVVNTSLVKVPKTWAQLEREALAFKRKSSDNLGIAVQQGSGGDAYHMYPFFSGLCGYVFKTTKSGALNPHANGVANKKFLKNASLIDRWNREGLINSKVTSGTAQTAFMSKKAAFWMTGPWNSDVLKKSGLSFRIIQVPKIKCAAVPFLGVQGFSVTKFASDHGVSSLAKDFVVNYLTKPSAQLALSQASGRFPANTVAGKQVHDSVLAQFGRAGVGGVPMPNIPEMASVWTDLGNAWVNSTKGAGATPARTSFVNASRNIAAKIG
jgi:arabinogalactan oligomer / maltooligosaccharide transport system substrate-binding protein